MCVSFCDEMVSREKHSVCRVAMGMQEDLRIFSGPSRALSNLRWCLLLFLSASPGGGQAGTRPC